MMPNYLINIPKKLNMTLSISQIRSNSFSKISMTQQHGTSKYQWNKHLFFFNMVLIHKEKLLSQFLRDIQEDPEVIEIKEEEEEDISNKEDIIIMMMKMAKEEVEVEEVEVVEEGEDEIMGEADSQELKGNKEVSKDKVDIDDNIEMIEAIEGIEEIEEIEGIEEIEEVEVDIVMTEKMINKEDKKEFIKINKLVDFLKIKNRLK